MMALPFTIYTTSSCSSCGGDANDSDSVKASNAFDPNADIPMKLVTVGNKTYNVADIDDNMMIYKNAVNRNNTFIVISKKEYRLYVYEVVDNDTILAAHFPICYAKYPEPKTESGDMRTPECTMDNPFTISQIQDASSWCHDFGDGRGELLSYGHWFMRLVTPGFTGVGIHGSTNNVESVPGRDSEGCIRLRDTDLLQLHDMYAQEGMKVIVKGINEGKLPFEVKAQQALGGSYMAPKPGNPYAVGAAEADEDADDAIVDEGDYRPMDSPDDESLESIEAEATGTDVAPQPQQTSKPVAGSGKKVVRLKTSDVNIRLAPNTDSELLWLNKEKKIADRQSAGYTMPYLGEQGDYYKVSYKGKEVYVSKQFTELVNE